MDTSSDYRISEKQEDAPLILQHFDLYCALISWVIAWAIAKLKDEEIQGFILCQHELKSVGIDLGEQLSLLIAQALDDPLVRDVVFFEYLTFRKTIRSAQPGEPVDGTQVWRLCLKSHPTAFPFSILLNAMEQECVRLGIKCQNLLFSYHNKTFDDLMKLGQGITSHEFDPFCVSHEFDFWRQGARGKLLGFLEACRINPHPDGTTLAEMPASERIDYVEENLPSLEPDHWRIGDYLFPIGEVAAILHCKVDVVRNWVRRGKGPGGVGWVEGKIVDGCRRFPAKEIIPYMREIQQRRQTQERHRRAHSNAAIRRS